jgi:phosphopantetheinyl transferase (holo-ACP synthase)
VTPPVRWRLGAPGRDGLPGLAAAGSWLCAAERARLGRLTVEKRRHDWLAGRLNAKALLAGLIEARVGRASVPSALEIARHPSGAPFARVAAEAAPFSGFRAGEVLPVALSNSHSRGHALCAAIWIDEGWTPSPVPAGRDARPVPTSLSLGADLEWIEPRSDGFVRDFLTPEDQAFCQGAEGRERHLRANLAWSAKEAVLKVLRRGLTVDTWWLTCLPAGACAPQEPALLPVEPDPERWEPLTIRLDPRLGHGRVQLAGVWREVEGFVATLALGR